MTGYRDAALACPRCSAPLARAGSAMGCRACRGVWLDEAVLDDMLRRMTGGHEPPMFFPRTAGPAPACPTCARPLDPVELQGVPVDRCTTGHGVWFDADELELALRNAGTPPEEPPLGPGETALGVLDLLASILRPFV